MALIEVDESEFAALKRVRDTVAKIANAPDAKKLLQKAHKLVDPNAVTPDLDADDAKEKDKSESQKQIDELKAQIAADKAEREKNETLARLNTKFEAGRAKLKNERRYTPQGIERVEKFMEERGIADHEIAADHLERQDGPPPEVMSPRAFGSFNFIEPPKDDDTFVKALLESKGDDDGAVLKAAVEAVGDLRGNARR